jgi:hypothetical protein
MDADEESGGDGTKNTGKPKPRQHQASGAHKFQTDGVRWRVQAPTSRSRSA